MPKVPKWFQNLTSSEQYALQKTRRQNTFENMSRCDKVGEWVGLRSDHVCYPKTNKKTLTTAVADPLDTIVAESPPVESPLPELVVGDTPGMEEPPTLLAQPEVLTPVANEQMTEIKASPKEASLRALKPPAPAPPQLLRQ